MRPKKPKRRVYRRLDANFPSDYIRILKSLSRKHKNDDEQIVGGALRVLRNMSKESFLAGRGEIWIPQPGKLTGHYPIMEKIPYNVIRTAIRKNTSEAVRARSWGAVESSAEPFVPLFSRRPGSLNEAQRRRLLAHMLVSLPLVKGRHPALLGKRVPGELDLSSVGPRSVVPIRQMAPEDWEKGFTMRKFSLSDDLSKSIQRKLTSVPRVPNPHPQTPKVDLKGTLKKATQLKVQLEPEQREYQEMMIYQTNTMARGYALSDIDMLCYEDGVKEWLKRTGRRIKRSWLRTRRWVKREVIPAVARGVTQDIAGLAHTELGMAPTTIDLVPVQRVGLKPVLQPYPSMQLRGVVQGLQSALLREVDPVLRRGFEKGIAEISTELMIRGGMLQ